MSMDKILNLHLISDGTCQTIKILTNAIVSHFEHCELKQYDWPLVKNQADLDNCFKKILQQPGMVLYTLRDKAIIDELNTFCHNQNLLCISALDHLIEVFRGYTGTEPSKTPSNRLNEKYFHRVQALEFALKHDDGQSLESIGDADIIIVGVSRSSKTPTSIYLANSGYKTANIPYIGGIELPKDLLNMQNKFIVGLIADPQRLIDVRQNRLLEIHKENHESLNTNYVNMANIMDECRAAKKIFIQHNWPIIDVTYKSVEETTAGILKLYYTFNSNS
jgi:regulator of PEP synthase PpsR (kinase-PPPase family)